MSQQIFERKNILVTGGAGFIGSHLCESLVKDAHVICIDNFATSQVSNLERLLQNQNFEFINHDITQPLELESLHELDRFKVKFQGIQEIYHLACPISKKHFDEFRIAMALTNSIGMKNMLDVAVQYKAKVLFASSSSLYGPKQAEKPYVQENDPCLLDHLTPSGAYDEGKRFSEALLATYADVYGLDVKISRLFRTYGPRMKIHDGNLLPDLINAALDGQELVLRGSEDSSLALCFVSDMVDGLIKHMHTPIAVTVVNLGSDQAVRLSLLAETIVRLTGSSSHVRFEQELASLFEAPLPDLEKARQVLHWLPLVRLEDGLKRMIEYGRSERQRVRPGM